MEQTQEDILRNNVKELQRQLQESYKRIKELKEELDNTKSRGNTHTDYGTPGYKKLNKMHFRSLRVVKTMV